MSRVFVTELVRWDCDYCLGRGSNVYDALIALLLVTRCRDLFVCQRGYDKSYWRNAVEIYRWVGHGLGISLDFGGDPDPYTDQGSICQCDM